jgi:hypothetical protein
LVHEKRDSLEAEFTVAEVEKTLEGGTQMVRHHGSRIVLGSEPSDERYSRAACESFVDIGLLVELGWLAFADSSFIPTSSPEMMSIPRNLTPESESVGQL